MSCPTITSGPTVPGWAAWTAETIETGLEGAGVVRTGFCEKAIENGSEISKNGAFLGQSGAVFGEFGAGNA